MPHEPISMNMAIWACSALSPNIMRATSLFFSGGGRWAMALPLAFSSSSICALLS
jgi:hypothetical protein